MFFYNSFYTNFENFIIFILFLIKLIEIWLYIEIKLRQYSNSNIFCLKKDELLLKFYYLVNKREDYKSVGLN